MNTASARGTSILPREIAEQFARITGCASVAQSDGDPRRIHDIRAPALNIEQTLMYLGQSVGGEPCGMATGHQDLQHRQDQSETAHAWGDWVDNGPRSKDSPLNDGDSTVPEAGTRLLKPECVASMLQYPSSQFWNICCFLAVSGFGICADRVSPAIKRLKTVSWRLTWTNMSRTARWPWTFGHSQVRMSWAGRLVLPAFPSVSHRAFAGVSR
jgi:hypothetical protein